MEIDTLEGGDMNNRDENKDVETCLVCGQNLDFNDDSIIRANLNDGSEVYAHRRCVDGLSQLLNQLGHSVPERTETDSLVRDFDGKWILTRHDFPNQYVPILIFFNLHGNTPVSKEELRNWLDLNDLDFSNPSVPIRRLVKRGALSVMVENDGTSNYFITQKGVDELNGYLAELDGD